MQFNKRNLLPIIASVGVGAATYYSMKKNNQGLGQTVQRVLPIVSAMSGMRQNH